MDVTAGNIAPLFSDSRLMDEISKYARLKYIAKGNVLIAPGDRIVFVPIVVKGVLRIVRQNNDGKEIFLYHLYQGQTCALAINCCRSHKESMVKAVAEDDTEVLQVPVNLVEEWFKYAEWKTFINSSYSSRFAELIDVIDIIAFNNMDKQVLHYLQERARAAGTQAFTLPISR